jgi:transcriptional regulator with XRE-family HTH domain
MLCLVCRCFVVIDHDIEMTRELNVVSVVAENVRLLRLKRSWSQEELADRCSLHRTYIGAIERGERNITVRTLFRIAEALGCEALELLKVRRDD